MNRRSKTLAVITAIIMCISVFAACTQNTDGVPAPEKTQVAPTAAPSDTVPAEDERAASAGELHNLGKYTPDDPTPWDADPDPTVREMFEGMQKEADEISEEDAQLLEELMPGYESATMRNFLDRFQAQSEKSDSFISATSAMSYLGMHDPFSIVDDFYVSLYFTLQEYYQEFGPPSVQDATYLFGYYRYFGKPGTEFDIMKTVSMSYDISIDYADKTKTTIGERDDRIVKAVALVNEKLDELSFGDWQETGMKATLDDIIAQALADGSDDAMRFRLEHVQYDDFGEES